MISPFTSAAAGTGVAVGGSGVEVGASGLGAAVVPEGSEQAVSQRVRKNIVENFFSLWGNIVEIINENPSPNFGRGVGVREI